MIGWFGGEEGRGREGSDKDSSKRFSYPNRPLLDIFSIFQIPDSTFIAVDDYANLKQMIDHLDEISKNKTKYLKYFQWMEGFE